MTETKNLHDAFFKEVFSRVEVARDFFAKYLPPEISAALDLSEIEVLKDSFVDPELQSHFSDLLYRVSFKNGKTGFVYILFEHKSKPEKFVAFQVLMYMVRIWDMLLRQKAKSLPPIFPLVLYHGRTRWNYAKNFSALIDFGSVEALRPFVPEFEYYLFDTANYDEEKANDDAIMQVGLAALKYIFRDDAGKKAREYFKHLSRTSEDKAFEFVKTLIIYLLEASGERVNINDVKASLGKVFSRQGVEKSMSTLQRLIQEGRQEGKQEGRQEGRQEGKQEGLAESSLRLAQRRFGKVGKRNESQIRKLPIEKLDALFDALLDMQTEKELNEWLRKNVATTVH